MFRLCLVNAVDRLKDQVWKGRYQILQGDYPTLTEAIIKNCRTRIVFTEARRITYRQ